LGSVRRALEEGQRSKDKLAEIRAAQALLEQLTPRERHVLDQLVAGRSNKAAAYELGISPRTIEIHRARIMDKMHAQLVGPRSHGDCRGTVSGVSKSV